MSVERRPAKFYFVPAGSVIVPAEVAALLVQYAVLDGFRDSIRGAHPDVDEVLRALHVAGVAFGSSERTEPARRREPEAPSPWVTAQQAADLLGRGVRAVQKAASSGRLAAQRVGGQWQIRPDDLEDYRRSRRGENAA